MTLKHIPEDERIERLFCGELVSQVYTRACNRLIRPNQGLQKRFLPVPMKRAFSLFYKAGHDNINTLSKKRHLMLRQLTRAIEAFASGLLLSNQVIPNSTVALEKVFSNIINHAYGDDRVYGITCQMLTFRHLSQKYFTPN